MLSFLFAHQVNFSEATRGPNWLTIDGMAFYDGQKTPFFAPFIYKMHYFTETGSGQT